MNRILLIVPLAFAVACSEGAGERTRTAAVDTLPNGALHVQNGAAGEWDSASSWRIEETVRIGSIEGEGPDAFGDVRDIEVDALGRVWVLDAQQKHIQVFEADGRHVRTVGRAGAGPGEIEDANGIELDAHGRLWVQDPGNARFSVFDTSGALVATHRRESILFSWIWPGGITRSGRIFDIDLRTPQQPGEHGTHILVERDSAGAVLDTIELPQFEAEIYEVINDEGRRSMAAGVPFTPDLEWRMGPDSTLWFGVSDDYRLVERTLAGDTLRVIGKEWTPVPVTQGERDTALAQEFIEEMRRGGADIDPGRIPANKPAWSTFWLDDDGYLWVVPIRERGATPVADLFDPDGYYLGAVELPSGTVTWAAPPILRGDRYYGVAMDELDVAYVVIGRVVGREATPSAD